MVIKEGKGGIKATIIADSVSVHGDRITTFELEYPRFIHCFDEDTEILSQINQEAPEFRSFPSVFKLDAKVAQYDENNEEITFVKPEDRIQNKGNHKMVSFSKKKFPLMVTDGHRVFTRKRTTNNAFVNDTIPASELTGNYGTRRIPQSGYVKTKQLLTDAEIEFCAWFVADGHSPKCGDQANFHFRKVRKVTEVVRVLNECGFEHTVSEYGDDYVIRFDKNYLTDSCYNDLGEKVFPDVALSMSQETYCKFKNALLLSDGNIDNCDYNTTSKRLIDQIQVVAHSHGDSINIRKYGSLFKCKFKKENYISLRQDNDIFEEFDYAGVVYCVTVPTSYVVVRRRGVVFISGNCELMTHRTFSRNAMSSRAVPVSKMIEQVRNNPAKPIHWGKNQAGMQASEESKDLIKYYEASDYCECTPEEWWDKSALNASYHAKLMSEAGYHKQIVNRLLEPFQMMKTIVTATEYENFFYLRCHKDAQPEIKELADLMRDLMESNEPDLLQIGEWHIPYVDKGEEGCFVVQESEGESLLTPISLEEALKVSASCCAQVSYRLLDNSIEKAIMIYDKLIESKPAHSSPFEHQAKVMSDRNMSTLIDTWDEGITHMDANRQFWSANFKGWVQHRQMIA